MGPQEVMTEGKKMEYGIFSSTLSDLFEILVMSFSAYILAENYRLHIIHLFSYSLKKLSAYYNLLNF